MQVKLNDNTELDCIIAFGRTEYIQGANRSVLELHFSPEDVTFESLEDVFSPSNSESIVLTDDENNSYLHENYVIRDGIALKNYEVSPPRDGVDGVYEKRYIVTLAQLTYAEAQIKELQDADLDNKEAIASLYEAILGGM